MALDSTSFAMALLLRRPRFLESRSRRDQTFWAASLEASAQLGGSGHLHLGAMYGPA